MTIVVMRHGHRDQQVDGPLLEDAYLEIWKKAQELAAYVTLQELVAISVSPYLRTRQTAELLQAALLKLTGICLPITIDLRLGEYNHRRCRWKLPGQEAFDPLTLQLYNGNVPLCKESLDVCRLRVQRYYQDLKDGTLIVTHNGIAMLLGYCVGRKIELKMGQYSLLTPQPVVMIVDVESS